MVAKLRVLDILNSKLHYRTILSVEHAKDWDFQIFRLEGAFLV